MILLNILARVKPNLLGLVIPKYTIYKKVHLSTSDNTATSTPKDFKTVYKFPYIRHFSLINRLKFYQTILTGVCIPSALVLNQIDIISFEAFQFVATLGLTGCFSLHGLGFMVTQFVGLIYYNESQNIVRISYADFWGRRKDIEVSADDIMPLNDLPRYYTDGLFLKIKRYSSKDSLKINLQWGIVVENELIKKIL